jgi:hypothetical protein
LPPASGTVYWLALLINPEESQLTRTIRTFALLAAILVALGVVVPATYAQMRGMPQFSADMVMTHRGESMQGKIYFGGTKMRFDMSPRGHQSIMIMDMPKQTSYMLMPQEKMYMEFNAAMAGRGHGPMQRPDVKPVDPSNPCASEPGVTCRKLGTEVVNGRTCDKWEFTREGRTQTVWVDQKLHFMVKTLGSDGSVTELKNIQEGTQPASLFEIPAGYRKFDMGGMMGRERP